MSRTESVSERLGELLHGWKRSEAVQRDGCVESEKDQNGADAKLEEAAKTAERNATPGMER